MTRFPLEALVEATGLSESALARRVRWSGTTLKAVREGGLSWVQADTCAVRCGLMPWDVWDGWLGDGRAWCQAGGCEEAFVPRDGRQRFCSSTCRHRERARRYRATERGRQVAREVQRRYREDPKVREYERHTRREARAAAGARRSAA